MKHLPTLMGWALLASLIMVIAYIKVPSIIVAVGVAIGYASIVVAGRLKVHRAIAKDIFLLVSFVLISLLSVVLLRLGCSTYIAGSECSDRGRNALLLACILFVGAPIVVLYLFDRIPRLLLRRRS
jgi:membrane-anchored glycerophosphoryl diester phosphodiesterase (GDPDase)